VTPVADMGLLLTDMWMLVPTLGLLLAEMWILVLGWGCCWTRFDSWCQDGASARRDVNAGAEMGLLLAEM
jgi:hypothetical protein